MKIIDKKQRQKNKEIDKKGLTQDIVKVWELDDFVVRLKLSLLVLLKEREL